MQGHRKPGEIPISAGPRPCPLLLLPFESPGRQRKKREAQPVTAVSQETAATLKESVPTARELEVWQKLCSDIELVSKTYSNRKRDSGKHSDF